MPYVKTPSLFQNVHCLAQYVKETWDSFLVQGAGWNGGQVKIMGACSNAKSTETNVTFDISFHKNDQNWGR